MPFVDTPRGRFAYDKYGSEGPVVYLLHGLSAKRADWGAVPILLANQGFRVFAFDLRGHGDSDWPETGYSPEDYAGDLVAWAEALGHPKTHLVGHSASGRHALVGAVLHPERVSSLAILDQTLWADPQRWIKYSEIYAGYPVPFKDEATLDEYLHGRFPAENRFQYYRTLFKRLGSGQWSWNFNVPGACETQRIGRAVSYLGWIPKMIRPLLFIQGGDSKFVSPDEASEIKRLLPLDRYQVLEGAGHAVWQNRENAFLQVLVPFLRSVS